ncbi:MAG: hypothetical protein JW769_04800 [Parachlamydiales bacterium]|nr:hypothetical protein [Parachlamydiales bacterium]
MQEFFSNFLVAVIIVIALTRFIKFWLVRKGSEQITASYVTFFIGLILLLPLAFYLGFDVVVSEYAIILILCLIYDVMRAEK